MSRDQITGMDPTVRNQSIKVDLDGTIYALRFEWSPRLLSWRVHVYDEAEQTHIDVLLLVLGFPLSPAWLPGFLQIESATAPIGAMTDLAAMAIYYTDGAGKRDFLGQAA